MRNLKRALSLALAAIMLIGMMAFGTSALSVSDFSDGDQITHTEAASVIAGLDIAAGYEDGSFRPDSLVTRAQMAVFVSKMAHGAAIDPAMFADEKNFTDYDGWSNGWVNLAYGDGIISGYGDGRFGPSDTVTVLQAATMVLKTIGVEYDADNWSTSVMLKASQMGLFGDLVVKADTEVTRDMMAVMVLEGLTYTTEGSVTEYTVDPSDDTRYSGSAKRTFTSAAEAYFYSQGNGKLVGGDMQYPPVVATETNPGSLGDLRFGLQKITEGETDDFGRPAIKYTSSQYDLDITIPNAPTYTLNGKVTERTLYDTVGKTACGGSYTWSAKVDGGAWVGGTPGAASTKPSSTRNSTNAWYGTGAGTVTQIYVGADTVDVVVINTYAGTVTRVTEAKNDDPRSINIKGENHTITGYETDLFAVDDVVLYTYANGQVQSIELAQPVSGTLTRIAVSGGVNTYTVDGVAYVPSVTYGTYATDFTSSNVGKTITFYVDGQDNMIMKAAAASTSSAKNYIYVLGNSASVANPNYLGGGSTQYTYEITGVLPDGTVSTMTIVSVDPVVQNAQRGVWEYAAKGSNYELKGAKITTKNSAQIKVSDTTVNSKIINSDTAFVFIEVKDAVGNDYTVENVTVRNGNTQLGKAIDAEAAILIVEGAVVKVAYILNAYEDEAKDTGNLVFVDHSTEQATSEYINGQTVSGYTYTAYDVYGSDVTVTAADQIMADGIYSLNDDNSLGNTASNTGSGYVTAINGSVVTVTSTPLNYAVEDIAFVADETELKLGQYVYYTKTGATSSTIARMWVTGEQETVNVSISGTDTTYAIATEATEIIKNAPNSITVTVSKKNSEYLAQGVYSLSLSNGTVPGSVTVSNDTTKSINFTVNIAASASSVTLGVTDGSSVTIANKTWTVAAPTIADGSVLVVNGVAVAITTDVESSFGSKVTVGGVGVTYEDAGDDNDHTAQLIFTSPTKPTVSYKNGAGVSALTPTTVANDSSVGSVTQGTGTYALGTLTAGDVVAVDSTLYVISDSVTAATIANALNTAASSGHSVELEGTNLVVKGPTDGSEAAKTYSIKVFTGLTAVAANTITEKAAD